MWYDSWQLLLDLSSAVREDNIDKVNTLINEFLLYHPKSSLIRCTLLNDAMKIAVEKGHLRIIEDLLKHGADVNSLIFSSNGNTLLHHAINSNDIEVVKLLINHGADVNAKNIHGQIPIVCAIEMISVEMTDLLLSSGTEIKYCPVLLHHAVKSRSMEIFRMILSVSDLDVNTSDEDFELTALHWTVSPKVLCVDVQCEMASAILSRGANVNAQSKSGMTALHYASMYKYIEVVGILLKHEADVNFMNNLKKKPLHFSAHHGNEAITRILLKNGARINDKDEWGRTALQYACAGRDKEDDATLIEFGDDIDTRDKLASWSPLIVPHRGSLPIVRMLLKLFADTECRDIFGETALHKAAKWSKPDIVRELLGHGFDININCNDGHTPFEYLRRRFEHTNNEHIIVLMYRHIVKMKAINMYVSPSNLKLIGKSTENKNKYFYEYCTLEIETSKNEKIGDTNVTFYDLMTKGIDKLKLYSRNMSIVKTLESGKYKKKFPIYANIIHNNFKKAQKHESLFYPSVKSLNFLLGFALPELLSAMVLNNLTIRELKNLIKAADLLQC